MAFFTALLRRMTLCYPVAAPLGINQMFAAALTRACFLNSLRASLGTSACLMTRSSTVLSMNDVLGGLNRHWRCIAMGSSTT